MAKSAQLFEYDASLLATAFFSSLDLVYDPDPISAVQKAEREFAKTGQVLLDIRPFYKTYGDLSKTRQIAGYVIKTEKEVIVSYRGSIHLLDFYRDAQFAKDVMQFGDSPQELHAGFIKDYASSLLDRNRVFDELQISREQSIVFTGHSLGGAVAQVAALDYAARDPVQQHNIRAIYTFGAPRVFSTQSSNFYNENLADKTLHIMAKGDPIVRVPPADWGFAHTGFYAMMRTLTDLDVKDHSYASYKEAIAALRSEDIRFGDTIKQSIAEISADSKKNADRSSGTWSKIGSQLLPLSRGCIRMCRGLIESKRPINEVDNQERKSLLHNSEGPQNP